MGSETVTVAVCGRSSAVLDELIEKVTAAGRWSVLPVHWPNPAAWASVRNAAVIVLHSDLLCAELATALRDRVPRVPLVALGTNAANEIPPDLWLPHAPVRLLSSVLEGLVTIRERAPTAPNWRRKSDMIIGNSPQMQQLLNTLDPLAGAGTPVLITGESGVGKELVARSLHFCGPRAKEPFVVLNCAAIPEQLFEAELFGYQRGAFTGAVNAKPGALELADKGTLFLDEIGELPLALQPKLLRVLETGEVQRLGSNEVKRIKPRLVSATNRDLDTEVEAGRFREDLYYRIMVYPVHVAPLRERLEDVPPLVTHHLSQIGRRENRPTLRMTARALEKLVGYNWPGNVRELVNLLERAVVVAQENVIDAEHVMFAGATTGEFPAIPLVYREAKLKFERDYFTQLLRTAGGNISLAAKLAQKTRKEIYDALKKLDIETSEYRDDGKPE